jgi:hypothetical protein
MSLRNFAAGCALSSLPSAQAHLPGTRGEPDRPRHLRRGTAHGRRVVSVRKAGAIITHTVVSDASGRFDFAPAKLAAGRYELTIRAVGFELDSAAAVEVPAANVELKLRKTRDLAAQLTNTEWFISMPGTASRSAR